MRNTKNQLHIWTQRAAIILENKSHHQDIIAKISEHEYQEYIYCLQQEKGRYFL